MYVDCYTNGITMFNMKTWQVDYEALSSNPSIAQQANKNLKTQRKNNFKDKFEKLGWWNGSSGGASGLN
jgi:hypothetical protein